MFVVPVVAMGVKWTTGTEPAGMVIVVVKFDLWVGWVKVEVDVTLGVDFKCLLVNGVKSTTGAEPCGMVMEVVRTVTLAMG